MVRHSRPMRAADRQSGPLGAAARGVLAMIAVSAVIGLAACGGAVPGAAGCRRESVGGRAALRGRPESGPGRGQRASQLPSRDPPARNHDQGRAPGPCPGSRALRAPADAARVALPGCLRCGGPAGVRGRRAWLPSGAYPALGLPQCHRGWAGPLVGAVSAVRAAAERDGWRQVSAGARQATEQRADAVTPVASGCCAEAPATPQCGGPFGPDSTYRDTVLNPTP